MAFEAFAIVDAETKVQVKLDQDGVLQIFENEYAAVKSLLEFPNESLALVPVTISKKEKS